VESQKGGSNKHPVEGVEMNSPSPIPLSLFDMQIIFREGGLIFKSSRWKIMREPDK